MATLIQKSGQSLIVRIPSPIAQQANLREGLKVSFSLSQGELIMSPEKKRYTLDGLLAEATAENFSPPYQEYTLETLLSETSGEEFAGEMAWESPMGNEIW
jgi:antitoxin MazE